MNEKTRHKKSGRRSAEETHGTRMRQADITDVRPLDLAAAREAVKSVVKEELSSEMVSADVLNFRMKHC